MIDIQILRDNPELVKEKSRQKQVDIDTNSMLTLDSEYRGLLLEVETLRQKRNELSSQMKNGKPDHELIEQGKVIKNQLSELEERMNQAENLLSEKLKNVPNISLDHVPVGKTEDENVVVKTVGNKPEFSFKPKTHWDIAKERDLFDKERAAKVSGSRFVYLKGGLVRLQFAIVQYVMDTLGDEAVLQKLINDNNLSISSKAFTPILPPAMLRTEPYVASARLNASEVTYKLEGDDLWLNASAEHTLCTMYWNEIIPEESLPIRYIGYSTSFRREAGTYGKDTEGIIRLHQFDKLEMEIFSDAETGFEEHKLLIAVQEYFMQQLGIAYNYVQKCTADIGKPNASGIDIDAWFPGQERFIETHTADYMTDYQARDLNIRTKKNGNTELVHTNDATAFALSRILAAIVENFQNEDGSINVPEVLQKYLGGKEKI
jgi:seryl-tRNA synthetase